MTNEEEQPDHACEVQGSGSSVEYQLFRLSASVLHIRGACVFLLLYARTMRVLIVLVPPVCLSSLCALPPSFCAFLACLLVS